MMPGTKQLRRGSWRISAMHTGARQNLIVPDQDPRRTRFNGDRRSNAAVEEDAGRRSGPARAGGRPRVFVAAENRLLREALSRMLAKGGDIEVAGMAAAEPFRAENLL